jgi:hypothetical protein
VYERTGADIKKIPTADYIRILDADCLLNLSKSFPSI